MITFHYKVNPKQKRKDGTMNVKIIVTYKRQRKMLPTSIYCTTDDITRGGKIKNQKYIDELENVLKEYRQRASRLGLEYRDLSFDEVVEGLKSRPVMDFFEFADNHLKTIKVANTRHSYYMAARYVEKYVGRRSLDFRAMTKSFFIGFERFLGDRHGGFTAGDMVMMHKVRGIYRLAQRKYNDEGNEVISSYPLIAYSTPSVPSVRKRALSIDKIREIKNLKLMGSESYIRDLFILSFGLMGMNLIDMFNAEPADDKVCYNRSKTQARRADRAYIEVDIDPRLKPYLALHGGKGKLLNISEKYTFRSAHTLVAEVMRSIGKYIGEEVTFYSARHSFATIAYNDCGVDKYVVHSALNHVSREMKITDVYIRRTFDKENEANKKVLDLLFKQGG